MKKLSVILLIFSFNIFSPLYSQAETDEADPNKELFPNIPNPFYEENADISYDEEPITFLGLNARWLSDKLPNHDIKHIFSFDFGYTFTGLSNNGWGIGLNYEQKIWRYFSTKFHSGTFTTKIGTTDTWCTGLRTDLTYNVYPFGKGLEWLYCGFGAGADFLFYTGEEAPETPRDIFFSLTPTIGWKQQLFKRNFMVDLSVGYRFLIDSTSNYDDNRDLVNNGFQVGIKFKFFWKQLLKDVVDNYILEQESLRFSRKLINNLKKEGFLTEEEASLLKDSL